MEKGFIIVKMEIDTKEIIITTAMLFDNLRDIKIIDKLICLYIYE